MNKNATTFKKQIRELLNIVSGNDFISMISSILTPNEKHLINMQPVECLKKVS